MSKWIRKNDKVVVIAGNHKGRSGKVIHKKETSVVVQGVNFRKKHLKRRTQETKSEIVEIEMPIHISNVMLCDDEGKPVKVKVRINSDGAKELYYHKSGKDVLYRLVRKH